MRQPCNFSRATPSRRRADPQIPDTVVSPMISLDTLGSPNTGVHLNFPRSPFQRSIQ